MKENSGIPKSNPSPTSQASRVTTPDFIRSDYAVANEWAMHGENLSLRIFSFYVTLVTATLGGALAIGQGLSSNFQSSFLILGAACVILLFAGPVFYEALVRDHIRNVGYRDRMINLRNLLMNASITKEISEYFESNSSTKDKHTQLLDPYHPSAIQHTLVGLINSFLVGISIPTLLWGIAGPGYKLIASLLAGFGAMAFAFLLHRVAARVIIRNYSDRA